MRNNLYQEKYRECLKKTEEVGYVERFAHPMVYVTGLPHAKSWEVVYFESGHKGLVRDLLSDHVEIMVLSNDAIPVGTQVSRSDEILEVKVGDGLLGKVVNALGQSEYETEHLSHLDFSRQVDTAPLGIEHRERVSAPLETGVSMVDFLIPLGKGQRELVIGDRNVGKTTFALQVILSQAKKGTVCIYTGIGKKKHSLKKVEEFFRKEGILDRVVMVVSSSSDPLAEQFLAPYTAMTIAEHFRDQGRDTLLVLDDLTNHAKSYRELALVSRKFPGRDSYPGDVFYIHARLLERAGNFKLPSGKTASITCLPIAEVIGGDISGYIQTNLMSITDGHIYFDLDMYKEGKRPAINYFISVTRVGRQTQNPVRWGINRELSSFMVLHNKTERFIHFGAEINEGIKSTLLMGDNINNYFEQSMDDVFDMPVQISMFCLIWVGVLKQETVGKIKYYITEAQDLYTHDKTFTEKVDQLINGSADFNALLGKVNLEYKTILAYLDKEVTV